MNASRFALATLLLVLSCSQVQAHFLFLRITPFAEAGRAAELYFSDLPDAGDTRFTGKIAHTQLWLQTTPGSFTPVKAVQGEDRLRAVLPPSGSVAVIGFCEYGVLSRKTPFLLRHFPKSIAGAVDDLNKMQPTTKVPLEIVATIQGDELRLVALHDGKQIPNAKFDAVGRGLKDVKFAAAADGTATWKPPHSGRFAIYTSLFTKKKGSRGEQKFEEIRDFATLCLSWPLAPTGADPAAVKLFQEAIDSRARWQKFPGFAAQIAGKVDGRPFQGSVSIDATGEVDLQVADDVAEPWVREQLESIVLHRRASDNPKSTKPVLRFADDETDHPLGRLLLFEGGRFASSYRVKDKQIVTVNRHVGKEYMTIAVLDNTTNADAQFLPRSYTVQYWDAATGTLRRTETVQERWQRVASWDLPAGRIVTTAGALGLSVRSFTMSKHELHKK